MVRRSLELIPVPAVVYYDDPIVLRRGVPGGKGVTMSRRLYRSRTDRVLGGVCGGLGAHFDTDPLIFRLVFVLVTLMGGSGILIYLIMLLVVPREPAGALLATAASAPARADVEPALGPSSEEAAPARTPGRGGVAGVILVALGALFLASNLGLFWWWKWKVLWPLVLIALGLWLLLKRNGKE